MQTGGIMAHWWPHDATPSTSSERDGSAAGSSAIGKRPRDDSRTYVPSDIVNDVSGCIIVIITSSSCTV